MFNHAYNSYLKYAYPYDELRPLSCDGVDTWGSYSLTLIDALDTLAIMGNNTEFQRVVELLTAKENFDANINVSVFETNIRIIGGLLSAHLLSHKYDIIYFNFIVLKILLLQSRDYSRTWLAVQWPITSISRRRSQTFNSSF